MEELRGEGQQAEKPQDFHDRGSMTRASMRRPAAGRGGWHWTKGPGDRRPERRRVRRRARHGRGRRWRSADRWRSRTRATGRAADFQVYAGSADEVEAPPGPYGARRGLPRWSGGAPAKRVSTSLKQVTRMSASWSAMRVGRRARNAPAMRRAKPLAKARVGNGESRVDPGNGVWVDAGGHSRDRGRRRHGKSRQ